MSLVATCLGKEYRIRIEEDAGGRPLAVHIAGPEGERVIPVRLVAHCEGRWTLEVGGRIEEVLITPEGEDLLVNWKHRVFAVQVTSLHRKLAQGSTSPATATQVARIRARMPGTVIRVLASEGQQVEAGEGLVIVEAMKMQNQIASPRAGQVTHCGVESGQAVNTGDLLFQIE